MALTWSIRALAAVVWLSGALFALFILAFYLCAIAKGEPAAWNAFLPALYAEGQSPAASIGIGVHFALGAVILLLGPVQFIGAVRRRWPRMHRIIGRTYVASALLTAIGGLVFISLRGTVGGPLMSVGFALYGILMGAAALLTIHHARNRQFKRHRAWAIRLFALAIGSWLYRMDYGFWFALFGKAGHTADFSGTFDKIMVFWFYLPNLLVAEFVIRTADRDFPTFARRIAIMLFAGASAFIALATFFFTSKAWGPAIAWGLGLGE
ncbi:DUF2306 domain-containing protein [Aurantiacibacter marinus]|uniref:DUF2306 domain-containing protein n=1 Tax=Aurantiacibacter marinus TaxID=874156 RepID=A0A0H0XQ43_9SPHN|nr:DUF2306 domain-containing protein [Aurantiacibacter marinus]KLI64449.1 hypothetical protein AAV99_02285 [Aurantiacibacter marinus]